MLKWLLRLLKLYKLSTNPRSPETLKDRPTRSTKNKTSTSIKGNKAHPQKLQKKKIEDRKNNSHVAPYDI
jgi:hypothetical protein